MAPILLSQPESKELAKKLEIYGHQSLQVRSVIISEFCFQPHGLQVWVDSWPEFTTVLPITLLKSGQESIQFCSVFVLDEEKLREMLETPEFIIWKKVHFTAYPKKCEYILQSFSDRFGCSLSFPNTTFQLLALNREKSKPRKIPEEVTVSTLTPDLAEFVHNNWEFGNPKNQDSETKYIKLLIESYPTVCLCSSEGKPIAYAIGQMYGGIGMLYVLPEYRNRGYGKTVMYLLSEKYTNVGYPPYVSVSIENTISNKIHNDLGFEPTDCFINWYTLKSK